jgi:hypothetical protein
LNQTSTLVKVTAPNRPALLVHHVRLPSKQDRFGTWLRRLHRASAVDRARTFGISDGIYSGSVTWDIAGGGLAENFSAILDNGVELSAGLSFTPDNTSFTVSLGIEF